MAIALTVIATTTAILPLTIAVLVFFGAGASWFNLTPYWSTNSQFITAIVVIGIIGLAIWWLGGSDDKPEAKAKGD